VLILRRIIYIHRFPGLLEHNNFYDFRFGLKVKNGPFPGILRSKIGKEWRHKGAFVARKRIGGVVSESVQCSEKVN
jgi:hypothetical protein